MGSFQIANIVSHRILPYIKFDVQLFYMQLPWAVSTLIDKSQRTVYKREMVASGAIDASLLERDKPKSKGPIPLFSLKKTGGKKTLSAKVKARIRRRDFTEVSESILSKDLISGEDLKRLREHVGIVIEEIFEVTRISLKVLMAIESDDTASLPQAFYLRNFLKAYAELFKLDSKKVIEGYLKNIAHLNNIR